MHESNLFSHVPAEPEVYPAAAIANQPVFSNAAAETRAAGETAPEEGTDRS